MASKPSSKLDWTIGNSNPSAVRVEPSASKKTEGWVVNERPPFENMNWLFYNIDEWIDYLEAVTDSPAEGVADVDFAQSPYSALLSARTVIVDTSGGSVIVNLPDSSANEGATFTITKRTSDSNVVTVDGSGAQTINGSTTYVLRFQYDAVQVRAENGNWAIVNTYTEPIDRVATLDNADTPYTVTNSVRTLLIDTEGSDFTINLPSVATNPDLTYKIKRIGNNTANVLVDANSSDTIDGRAVVSLNRVNDSIELFNDGTQWRVMSSMFKLRESATSSEFLWSSGGFNTGDYMQMSGNSLSLPVGVYRISGYMLQTDNGTDPDLTQVLISWGEANGNNTSTPPTGLGSSNTSNVVGFNTRRYDFTTDSAINRWAYQGPDLIVSVDTASTIYLNAQITFGSAGNAGMIAYLLAEKIDI